MEKCASGGQYIDSIMKSTVEEQHTARSYTCKWESAIFCTVPPYSPRPTAKLWRVTRYTNTRRRRRPIPTNASQFNDESKHFLQARPERVKEPWPCSLSRSHDPQSGPKYPFATSQVRTLFDSSNRHDSPLKQVYVFVDAPSVVALLKSYHVDSSSLRRPPAHCAPRVGHAMQFVLGSPAGVYSPMAHVWQNALLASGALPRSHFKHADCPEAATKLLSHDSHCASSVLPLTREYVPASHRPAH